MCGHYQKFQIIFFYNRFFKNTHNFILIKITIDLIGYNRLFIKIIKAFLKIFKKIINV